MAFEATGADRTSSEEFLSAPARFSGHVKRLELDGHRANPASNDA
jgi:hypothetical protein